MPRGSWWPGRKGSRYPAGAKLLGLGTCGSGGGSCARGGPRRRRNARSPGSDRADGKSGPRSHRGLGLGAQGRLLEGRGRGREAEPLDPGASSCAGSSGPRCRALPNGRLGRLGRCVLCAACRAHRSGARDTGHPRPPLRLCHRLRAAHLESPRLGGSGWTTRTQRCSGGSCTEN